MGRPLAALPVAVAGIGTDGYHCRGNSHTEGTAQDEGTGGDTNGGGCGSAGYYSSTAIFLRPGCHCADNCAHCTSDYASNHILFVCNCETTIGRLAQGVWQMEKTYRRRTTYGESGIGFCDGSGNGQCLGTDNKGLSECGGRPRHGGIV